MHIVILIRSTGRSENLGVPAVIRWAYIICPPLVEIGLTDLPKSGCAIAHLADVPRDDTPWARETKNVKKPVSHVENLDLRFL